MLPEDTRLSALTPTLLLIGGAIDVGSSLLSDVGGFLSDLIWDFVRALVNLFTTGLLDAVGLIYSTGAEYFLFFQNPYGIAELNDYWYDTLPLFAFIAIAMTIVYFLTMILLADEDKAQPQRMIARLIRASIYVFISKELVAFFVTLTHQISFAVYPASYTFQAGAGIAEQIVATAGNAFVALAFAAVSTGSLILMGMVFFTILAIRMLIVYVVYAIFPVIMGFWIVDVGPAKYGKTFADIALRGMAAMLVVGLLISGFIAVGDSIADPDTIDGGLAATEDQGVASLVETESDDTIVMATGRHASTTPQSADGGAFQSDYLFNHLVALMMYLGVMFLSITTILSVGGVVISAGAASPGGAGGFSGRGSASGGGGGAVDPSGHSRQGIWAEEMPDGSTSGTVYTQQLDDGRVVLTNPAGGGTIVNPNPTDDKRKFQPFEPENNPLATEDAPPNPFNDQGAPTVAEKARRGKEAMKDTVSSGAEKTSEALDKATSKAADEATDRMSDEQLEEITAGSGNLSDGVDEMKESFKDAKSDVETLKSELEETHPWKAAAKAGNLAKRVGKAGGSVIAQPSAIESLDQAEEVWDNSAFRKKWEESGLLGASPPEEGHRTLAHNTSAFDLGEKNASGESPWIGDDVERYPDYEFKGFGDSPWEDRAAYKYGDQITPENTPPDIQPQAAMYQGRGPSLRDNLDDDGYGHMPQSIDGVDTGEYGVMHHAGTTVADNIDVERYEDIEVADVMSEIGTVGNSLVGTHGLDPDAVNTDFSHTEIKSMLDQQARMGVPPNVAIKRTSETILNSSAASLSKFQSRQEVLDEFGVNDVPSQLATDAPVRRIHLGSERGVSGSNVDDMYRVGRNDGSIVYEQDVSDDMDSAINSIRTEEILDMVGVDSPMTHHDPVNGVLRTQGIQGDTLAEISSGDVPSSEISRDDLLDSFAAMGLAGHTDVTPENLVQREDGSIVPISTDSATPDALDDTPDVITEGPGIADSVGVDIDDEDITERMQEMASEVREKDYSLADRVDERTPDPMASPSESVVDHKSDSDQQLERVDEQVKAQREEAMFTAIEHDDRIEAVSQRETSWQQSTTQTQDVNSGTDSTSGSSQSSGDANDTSDPTTTSSDSTSGGKTQSDSGSDTDSIDDTVMSDEDTGGDTYDVTEDDVNEMIDDVLGDFDDPDLR